jgi:lipoate-protein ligase A
MAAREAWRLLYTFEGEPGWNMALDEALLAGLDPRPTLRFYSWRPTALSLGYFQRFEPFAALAEQHVIVRRATGGGAIHHADELTFSLAAAQEHALFRGEVRRSYERIHALLARAFAPLGVHAGLRAGAHLASDRAGTGMCFHASTALDLTWGGRKGVGSAQRRRGGRVLHHGSIKLGPSELEPGVAHLRERAPEIEAAAVARAIAREFERELALVLEPGEPSSAELKVAARRAPFYRSPEFLQRR